MNLQSTPSPERRREERIAARFQVRFAARQQAARALRAYSVNLSSSGLCLKTRRAYEVGMLMWLRMQIGEEVFDMESRVAWVRPGVIGLRFLNVSNGDQARLQQVLADFGK